MYSTVTHQNFLYEMSNVINVIHVLRTSRLNLDVVQGPQCCCRYRSPSSSSLAKRMAVVRVSVATTFAFATTTMMLRTALNTLPIDVLDEVLTTLPSRAALLATIAVSQIFYDRFKHRRDFFVLHALLNEDLTALRFALVLARAYADLDGIYLHLQGQRDEGAALVCRGVRDRLCDPSSTYWTRLAAVEDVPGLLEVLKSAYSVECSYSLKYVSRGYYISFLRG